MAGGRFHRAAHQVFCITWYSIGWQTIVILGGMSSIDPSVFEAARMDGANFFQRTFKVVLPMITSVITYCIVMAVVWTFTSLFSLIYSMTGGGPGYETMTLDYMIYEKSFVTGSQLGMACTISVVLFAIVMIITAIEMKLSNMAEKKWGCSDGKKNRQKAEDRAGIRARRHLPGAARAGHIVPLPALLYAHPLAQIAERVLCKPHRSAERAAPVAELCNHDQPVQDFETVWQQLYRFVLTVLGWSLWELSRLFVRQGGLKARTHISCDSRNLSCPRSHDDPLYISFAKVSLVDNYLGVIIAYWAMFRRKRSCHDRELQEHSNERWKGNQ
jgi:hypothetical protein